MAGKSNTEAFERLPSQEIKERVKKVKENLSSRGYNDLSFLARGKRGLILYGKKGSKKVCIKYKNPFAKVNTIKHEFYILRYMRNMEIAPKPIELEKNFLAMEYIEGKLIKDFIEKVNKSNRDEIILLFWQLIDYMVMLDLIGLNKQEMNHPQKHIIINKRKSQKQSSNNSHIKPYLVDFERARFSKNPKNLSQFISYISGTKLKRFFGKQDIRLKGKRLREFISSYKKEVVKQKKISAPKIVKDFIRKNTTEQLKSILKEIKLCVFLSPKDLRDKVLIEAGEIPRGKTCSYSYLAKRVGTKAYRVVGSIMANNKFNPVIPCHRVIKANRELGSFNHKEDNLRKKDMLEKEGVDILKQGNKFYVSKDCFLG